MNLSDVASLTFNIGRNAWITRRPFLLYFKPTARCDLRCAICNRGQVYSCEDPAGTPIHEWTDCSSFEPERVYASPQFKAVTTKMQHCNRCRLPCVVELSNNLTASLLRMFARSVTKKR